MAKTLHAVLSRRERQIIDVLYRRGRATAAAVMADLPGPPSYAPGRTQLRGLEAQGHVRHEDDGQRFVYSPAVPRGTVRRSALKHLVETFYEGSVVQAVAALLGGEGSRLTDDQLDRIEDLIKKARKEDA